MASAFLGFRASNSNFGDFAGWHAQADRNALAIFATAPTAVSKLQIGADHSNFGHHVRAVAIQSDSFQRRGQFTVFDQIAFRTIESEIASDNFHLSASEARGVNAFAHGLDDREDPAAQAEGVGAWCAAKVATTSSASKGCPS